MIKDTDQLTRAEAAEVLGVSIPVLAKLAARKEKPPFYKLTHKVVRYARGELMKWREDRIAGGR
jgi:predicted DNA-binding transcriptional regulator AlpA